MKKSNYLNNKDLLEEIHKSKNSYSSFLEPEYHEYDIIVNDISLITPDVIEEAKKNKAKKLSAKLYEEKKLAGDKKVKLSDCEIFLDSIKNSDLIFRIMTYDHIPLTPGRKKTTRTTADKHEKINFPPFQHWKFDENNNLICVGKSHWIGGMDNGYFSKDHGKFTRKLAQMFIDLAERYGTRRNVRNYCVDTETQALTDKGWVDIDQISEENKILSYNDGKLIWSKIKSIYRGEYNGLMHKMTVKGFDSLVTPEHKFVTDRGLVKAELLKEKDRLILMGDEVQDTKPAVYCDSFVELTGWIMTEGSYEKGRNGKNCGISIYQNNGVKADKIRNCLINLNYKFSESNGKKVIRFRISAENSKEIQTIFQEKNLTMEFINQLTSNQRKLLIETMIDGDGWRTNGYKRYCQKDPKHVDLFQALCALSGIRSQYHLVNNIAFGKPVSYYNINLFTKRKNVTPVERVNFHGGKNNGKFHIGLGKDNHPNKPTTAYSGRVWCPETEYGCFIARRNGSVFLTGNTYNDEMKSQAILQLTQIGLQFDESKSNNPFAYYTAAVINSFVRIINVERKNQNIRDDILEMNSLNPSYTRQSDNEWSMMNTRKDDKD